MPSRAIDRSSDPGRRGAGPSDDPEVLAVLGALPLRAWAALLLALLAAAQLGGDLVDAAIGPRYVSVPLADARKLSEATLALDRRAIRWRASPDAALRVEAPRAGDARRALAREGLVRTPRRSPAPTPTTEQAAATALERQVDRMLAETVGRDKALVELDVDLALDRVAERQLRYARRAVPAVRDEEWWRLRGAVAEGDGRYDRVRWARGRSVRATRFAPGDVRRISGALVLDPSVSGREAREVRRAVRSALGIDRRRGDVLRVSRVPVALRDRSSVARTAGFRVQEVVPAALLLVGSTAFLLELWRCLRRRAEEIAQPTWLP